MTRQGTRDDTNDTNVPTNVTRVTRGSTPSGVFRVGDVIDGRYRLDAPLGRGAFGAVFRATQLPREGEWGTVAGRGVAIKVLHHEVLANAMGRERFRREALLAQKLQHPNIVHLHDFGETDEGIPYIVFELLVGRTLDAVLKEEGPLAEPRVVRVAVQLLKALMEAHAVGIVHRDIKPANIFVCDFSGENDFVKVLDFGVAKSVGVTSLAELTRTGQLVGTPAYMAPELLRGGTATPASDLYALGLMLIRLLSGELAYKGTAAEVIHGQLSAEPVPLSPRVAQSSIAHAIRRAVEKDPSRRPPTASAMLDDLLRGASTPRAFTPAEATHVRVEALSPTPQTMHRVVQPTPQSLPWAHAPPTPPTLAAPLAPVSPVVSPVAFAPSPPAAYTPVQRAPSRPRARPSRTGLVVALVLVGGAITFSAGILGTRAILTGHDPTTTIAAASTPLLKNVTPLPVVHDPSLDPPPIAKEESETKPTIDGHLVRQRLEALGWKITNKPTTDVSGVMPITRIEAKQASHEVTVMVYECGSTTTADGQYAQLLELAGAHTLPVESRRTVLSVFCETLSDAALSDLATKLADPP